MFAAGQLNRVIVLVLFTVLMASAGHSENPLELVLPVDCELRKSCVIQHYVDHDPSGNSSDFACGKLTYDGHNGTDFRLLTTRAQRVGVNILAAADGVVTRTRDGARDIGGLAKQSIDVTGRECGNGVMISHRDGWETQYCHLRNGSIRVKSGARVNAGTILGAVGLSGLTEFPHLHFTVRHQGQVVDPFAHGAPKGICNGGVSLWDPAIREALRYEKRAVINAGFSSGAMTMNQIEMDEFDQAPDWSSAPALVAYVRTIGLQAGDSQSLAIRSPSGEILAERLVRQLDRGKAQMMLFVGAKRKDLRWTPGIYTATYVVMSDGGVVLEKRFSLYF